MPVYAGMFLIAFSTLALEVTLTRLLSVVTWYHLAFFAISAAMLGMTAGATHVYLRKDDFHGDRKYKLVAEACLHFGISIPVSLVVICLTPLAIYPNLMSPISFLLVTIACSLPFYFSGIVITAVLTRFDLPIGRIYGSDLIGAALGCLFVLGGLEILDAPSLIVLSGGTAVLGGVLFAWRRSDRPALVNLYVVALFVLAAAANSQTERGIRPVWVKDRIEPAHTYRIEKWNSYSRVAVHPLGERHPDLRGASPLAPKAPSLQYRMTIDGAAGTRVGKFTALEDVEHLLYDVTNVGYYLRQGVVCIVGVGGGRDIQSAILFGAEKVIGIEVNPIFNSLLENEFREFAGVAGREDVELVTDEARSYLSRSRERFDVIQMSLIDTWAATGAGAYSLSENGLYTVEAWKVFLGRLSEDGLFMVSRWHDPENLGETGRLLSLAVRSLLELSVARPAEHLAMISIGQVSTLLVSRRPFTSEDIAALLKVGMDLQYRIDYLPGRPTTNAHLSRIVASTSLGDLEQSTKHPYFNYQAPTDDSPYFFNMLRLRGLGQAFASRPGVVRGNLVATVTLVGLLLALGSVAVATIVLPLALRRRYELDSGVARSLFWSGALYFSLIGAGFMFLEIALIQRLSIFLGHPTYALGILLFTIIASTGVGSFLSDRLPLTERPWVYVYPVLMVIAIVLEKMILGVALSQMITSPMSHKIAASVATIFPLGICMGLFFPAGMRLAGKVCDAETPWYWALNGIFGVLSSAVAVFVAIYLSVSTNFWIAAGCYGAVLVSVRVLESAATGGEATAEPAVGAA
jgi:hypothetical protein